MRLKCLECREVWDNVNPKSGYYCICCGGLTVYGTNEKKTIDQIYEMEYRGEANTVRVSNGKSIFDEDGNFNCI